MSKDDKIIVHVDADLEPILPRFMELRYDDIDMINELLESGDYETIRRIGHSMKGAGGGYGFDHISVIGKGIEDAAKDKEVSKIRQKVNQLSNYLERVEVIFDE